MIPALKGLSDASNQTVRFLEAVRDAGFAGAISHGAADRIVLATDNSVYQAAPDAVLFPRTGEDLARIARTLSLDPFREVAVRPRGGGTGTTGASLGPGISVDLSRYMNQVLEINVAEGWARVQAGVVKDQLNALLKPHGVFFAPELAPSNRATLGGMISTDACGQGSVLYGKTSDHVLELEVVFTEGTRWSSRRLTPDELAAVQARPDIVGAVHRAVDRVQRDNAALIAECFPKLNRSLTGYDLAHIRDAHGDFNLNSVICGSEGTLVFIVEAKVRVLPIPKASVLVAVRYRDFIAALRDARALMAFGPASIETVDTRVLDLARDDNIWSAVSRYFPDDDAPLAGINLVEFFGDDDAAVGCASGLMTAKLDAEAGPRSPRLGYSLATGAGIQSIWEMRKRAVGLLGNGTGRARPVPFIEDCAVPPERLADFVAEFRALLDAHGLEYGMYGHVDAGVLHVRPAMDLVDPAQEPLIRELTEAVAALAGKYGGLLWGEHGKGMRSEFVPAVFGPLYPCLVAIKTAFDPHEQLNPGKVATAGALLKVDGLALRGQFDRVIPDDVRPHYDGVLSCNGNGACFNYDANDPMCPSWKATRERRHSPKGRASLIREWLRLLALEGIDPVAEAGRVRAAPAWRGWLARSRNSRAARRGAPDFAHQVKEALDGCLGCNACSGQCPVKVSIPTFRAKFFELYYGRYLRPARDHVVGAVEGALPLLARAPGLTNRLARGAAARAMMARVGLVDAPALSGVDLGRALRKRGLSWADPDALASLDENRRARSVVLVQDAFTSYFETGLVLDFLDLLVGLGFEPWVAPYQPNGTPLHVLGFLGAYTTAVNRNADRLEALARTGVPLVGLDPPMTLAYRAEYGHVRRGRTPTVQLPQEWLAGRLDDLPRLDAGGDAYLLPHCTEKATALTSLAQWGAVFERFGLTLHVVPVGCCGMAGNFGHEAEHHAMSRAIFADGWARQVGGDKPNLMATGFSCRAQAERFGGRALPHPVQVLLATMRGRAADASAERELAAAG